MLQAGSWINSGVINWLSKEDSKDSQAGDTEGHEVKTRVL